MRSVVRIFFRLIRLLLTPVVLLGEWLLTPRGMQRSPEAQARVDGQTRSLTLYQFRTCPFCIRVRLAMKRLALDISTKDTLNDREAREQLHRGGGEIKVPCLCIQEPDGGTRWMYESKDIVAYLDRRFGGTVAAH